MNDRRRKKLRSAYIGVQAVIEIVSIALDEESDYLNSIPESFTDKIESTEENVDILSDAVDMLNNAGSMIEDAYS